jgi:translation elongation factor EF-1beta
LGFIVYLLLEIGNMSKFSTVDELNNFLKTKSYIEGYSYTIADKNALESLSGIPSQATFPHAYRWAVHIAVLVGISNVSFRTSGLSTAAPAAKTAPAAPAKKDDFDDMFGDDEDSKKSCGSATCPCGDDCHCGTTCKCGAGTVSATCKKPAAKAEDFDDMFGDDDGDEETAEEKAATKARTERMALAKKLKEEKDAKEGVKQKAKPVEKSLVVLEVKPWEADCNLEAVWRKIIEYKQEGLTWGESFKLEPIAYGIMKLIMTCTIVDSLVLMDDITDNIEAMEEFVQSVNVASMNKI